MRIYISIASFLIILSSCQKEVAYDFPEDQPRLSLFSMIQAGDTMQYFNTRDSTFFEDVPTIEALLLQSYSIMEDMEEYYPAIPSITDAQVLLYEDNSLIGKLICDTTRGINQNPFGYSSYELWRSTYIGKTYRYEVTHPDFPPVSAEVTIPDSVPLIQAEHNTIESSISFSFNDPPGVNFYRFSINGRDSNFTYDSYFSTSDPDVEIFDFVKFDSIILKSPNEQGRSDYSGYLRDDNFNGTTKTVLIHISDFPEANYMVYLESISPDYYEFLRTLDTYMATKDNPFAEAVKIHSNVKNGVGMVGATTTTSKLAIKK